MLDERDDRANDNERDACDNAHPQEPANQQVPDAACAGRDRQAADTKAFCVLIRGFL